MAGGGGGRGGGRIGRWGDAVTSSKEAVEKASKFTNLMLHEISLAYGSTLVCHHCGF